MGEYRERLDKEPERIHNVYESNDLYYLAGYYDPTAKRLQFEDGVFTWTQKIPPLRFLSYQNYVKEEERFFFITKHTR